MSVISVIAVVINSRFTFLLTLFVLLLGIFTAAPLIINPVKTQSKINFQNKFCEIDDNYLSMNYEDGSLEKIHFNNFLKIVKQSEYYFLYTTKVSLHYLPIRAFNTEDDVNKFDNLVKSKELIR